MFRSCQIIIRELCSWLQFCYSIHNSIRICKRGVVAAYHVVWECVVEQWLGVHCVWECVVEQRLGVHCVWERVVEQWLGVRRMLSNKRLLLRVSYYSAHDMLPQHLVCKYELNCEYCNITLARNKAP